MVEEKVRDCFTCGTSDKAKTIRKSPLVPVPIPTKPWDKLGLDIIGPLNLINYSQRYMFVLIDYHSHWIATKMVATITTSSLIEFLKDTFSKEGIPSTLITDNGVQFTSDEMKQFMTTLSITHLKSPLYCPKANGLV